MIVGNESTGSSDEGYFYISFTVNDGELYIYNLSLYD